MKFEIGDRVRVYDRSSEPFKATVSHFPDDLNCMYVYREECIISILVNRKQCRKLKKKAKPVVEKKEAIKPKTKLIPFDWELYKAGAKAVLKTPRPNKFEIISIINSNLNEDYPLHVIYKEDGVSFNASRSLDGCPNFSTPLLLEVPVVEHELWINFYVCGSIGKVNKTRESADKWSTGRKGVLRVTYTDEDLINA